MKILHVAGARPNFMKVAPVMAALRARGIHTVLIHTGQHYDDAMSALFFEDLSLPEPDEHLGVGSGSHAQQTARVMERIEPVLERERPDLTVVVGDVNSTLASALVCAKLGLPVAHIEAGLRSFDRSMPEEVNRVLTDQVSDLLFTTSPEADENLVREGIARERIHFVGNPMIDSLEHHLPRARRSDVLERFSLTPSAYALLTLHRPSNVDERGTLEGILDVLTDVARTIPVLFPVHPRTRKMIEQHALSDAVSFDGAGDGIVRCTDPLGYIDFLRLMADARVVLTDSGGIQEETTILGVPCLTLRANTERPITIDMGTNRLVGTDPQAIRDALGGILENGAGDRRRPPLWDGRAGERIAETIERWAARAR